MTFWPAELLTALVLHGAQITGAPEVAIALWAAGGEPGEVAPISTSQEARWLEVVAARVPDSGEPPAATASAGRAGVRALALAGLSTPAWSGILIAGRPGGEAFSTSALERLGSVGGLVVAALQADRAQAPAPASPATPRAGALRAAPPGAVHHQLPEAFRRLEGLPALTESRDVLLGVLGGPTPSHGAIIAAIESDVALLVAVLRLANAAAGSRRPAIWSVPDAVSALTPEGVETMARRITVFDFFQRIRGWAVPPEHFRLHAVACQRAAERLARVVDHPEPDRLMVAALLHDIGKLVLMEAFPSYPDPVLAGAVTPEQRLEAERRGLGLDHQMAGGVLLRRWRLPQRLAQIVAGHHGATEDRDAALVGLSDALAHYTHGQPVSPPELRRLAEVAGLTGVQLRTIMYELSQPDSRPQGRHATPSPLTRRQTEMVRELAKGLTYKDIADEVGVSMSTVRSHLSNVYERLGVVDRAQAVLTATERGWI